MPLASFFLREEAGAISFMVVCLFSEGMEDSGALGDDGRQSAGFYSA